jgi:hypothetical protein
MAADTVQVKGLDELKRKLADVPKALRKRVLRNALAAGAPRSARRGQAQRPSSVAWHVA